MKKKLLKHLILLSIAIIIFFFLGCHLSSKYKKIGIIYGSLFVNRTDNLIITNICIPNHAISRNLFCTVYDELHGEGIKSNRYQEWDDLLLNISFSQNAYPYSKWETLIYGSNMFFTEDRQGNSIYWYANSNWPKTSYYYELYKEKQIQTNKFIFQNGQYYEIKITVLNSIPITNRVQMEILGW